MDGLTGAYFASMAAGTGFYLVSLAVGHGARAGHSGPVTHGGHAAVAHGGHGGGGGHGVHASHGMGAGPPGHGAAVGHATHGPARPPGALAIPGIGGWLLAAVGNLAALSAVAAIGGGAGYLARTHGMAALASLGVALPCGLIAGLSVHWLASWLEGQTRYREPATLQGTVGRVLVRAAAGQVGEIQYEQDGLRRTMPAARQDGNSLDEGLEVVILDVSGGIAHVMPTLEFLKAGSHEPS